TVCGLLFKNCKTGSSCSSIARFHFNFAECEPGFEFSAGEAQFCSLGNDGFETFGGLRILARGGSHTRGHYRYWKMHVWIACDRLKFRRLINGLLRFRELSLRKLRLGQNHAGVTFGVQFPRTKLFGGVSREVFRTSGLIISKKNGSERISRK